MADFKNYDPKKVVITFGGVPMLGFMDGTFCVVDYSEDAYELAVGAAGDVTRVRSNDFSGTVTVTIKQESATNDLLSAIAAEDRLFNTGVRPLMVKDLNGNTLAEAPNAWIQKLPAVEYSDGAGAREWVFACAELIVFVGGAVL